MDCISKQHECIHRNFRTGGSLKYCQNDFWHRDQELQSHQVKSLFRTRSWTGWSFWVSSNLRDSRILWMVNKRMVRNCEGCSLCPLYLLKNWILNMCSDETTQLWQRDGERQISGKHTGVVKWSPGLAQLSGNPAGYCMNYRAQPEHGRAEPKKSFNTTLQVEEIRWNVENYKGEKTARNSQNSFPRYWLKTYRFKHR